MLPRSRYWNRRGWRRRRAGGGFRRARSGRWSGEAANDLVADVALAVARQQPDVARRDARGRQRLHGAPCDRLTGVGRAERGCISPSRESRCAASGTMSTGHRARVVTRRDTPPSRTARPGPYPRDPMIRRSRCGETLTSASAASPTSTSLRALTPWVSSAMADATVPSSAARLKLRGLLARACGPSAPGPGFMTVSTRRSASAISATAAASRSARRPYGVATNVTPMVEGCGGELWP